MFYVKYRESLSSHWITIKDEDTDTKLLFPSREDAVSAAIELAIKSTDMFAVFNAKDESKSLIYTGKNPYSNLI